MKASRRRQCSNEERYRDVLRLSKEGLSTGQIAATLRISPSTVRGYRTVAIARGDWKRTPQRAFTDEQLLELVEKGKTRKQIAKALGCCQDAVERAMVRLRPQLPPTPLPPVLALMREGKSAGEIAKVTGRPLLSVHQSMSRYRRQGKATPLDPQLQNLQAELLKINTQLQTLLLKVDRWVAPSQDALTSLADLATTVSDRASSLQRSLRGRLST